MFRVAFALAAALSIAPASFGQATPSPRAGSSTGSLRAKPDAGRAALNRPIGELKLDKVPLSDALDFLRDSANLNLHVNWRALEAVGVAKDAPVSVRLNGVSVRKALNTLLASAGAGGTGGVSWYIDEGVIEVTTQALADRHLYTRVYTVEDLLMVIPDFIGPAFSLQQQAGSQGGGGQSLFQSNNQQQPNLQPGQSLKTQRGQDLIKTITDTVRPDIWKQSGGPATIAYYNGMLVVTAPQQVHDEISGR